MMSSTAPPNHEPSSGSGKPNEASDGWLSLAQTFSPAIVVVVGVVASMIFGTLAESNQQVVQGVGALLALGLAAGVWYYKRRWRRPAPQPAAPLGNQTAFRGLASFGEADDDIPGDARRREAGACAAQIQDARFTFGVISGETGAGKSSLLACGVQKRLRQADVPVVFVPNPRALCQRTAPVVGADLAEVRRDVQALKDQVAARAREAGGAPVLVLLIDQFEEFMIDYPLPEQRRALAEGLAELMRGAPRVKTVVAVRKDYLLDLHDLHDGIPEPLATAAVTYLKNFTVAEAARVIEECARLDGARLDDGFAERVAHDLSEKGFVRPPELQIICTELRGTLTLASYSEALGAAGILRGHVEKSLVGLDPAFGRRLLRELCDFPARAKKNPQTVAEIRDKLQAVPSVPASRLDAVLAETLNHLERSRLLRAERNGTNTVYSLAQDYLVDAIALATRDVSTRAEEAEHVVDYTQRGIT